MATTVGDRYLIQIDEGQWGLRDTALLVREISRENVGTEAFPFPHVRFGEERSLGPETARGFEVVVRLNQDVEHLLSGHLNPEWGQVFALLPDPGDTAVFENAGSAICHIRNAAAMPFLDHTMNMRPYWAAVTIHDPSAELRVIPQWRTDVRGPDSILVRPTIDIPDEVCGIPHRGSPVLMSAPVSWKPESGGFNLRGRGEVSSNHALLHRIIPSGDDDDATEEALLLSPTLVPPALGVLRMPEVFPASPVQMV